MMVATDIAARGINIQAISHVINFDVPAFAEDYIHRIGRTGRAAATGDAMTFVSEDEVNNLRKIERFIERTFELTMADGFAYTHRVTLESKPRTDGKKSKPGSAQRKRAKAQQGQTAQAEQKQPAQQERPKKKSSFKRSKKKSTGKAGNSFGGQRSESSKPKNKKKSWSKKKRFNRGSETRND